MPSKQLGIVFAIAMLPAFGQVPAGPAALRHNAPIRDLIDHKDGTVTSGNWSGYAITGSAFTNATASWIVPAVSCSSGTQYAVFWVGIDGYSSNTVEQTGTEAVCSGGKATY